MPFGEIVVGSPGSGKSTYCYGKHQLFTALNRPISIVNLDPANDNIPYPCAIDIASLITLQDAMSEHGLGPNGGMLYCMEYLEANYDWLEDRLGELGKEAYVLFDLPGQVELSTNHNSLKRIIEKLGKSGFRVCVVLKLTLRTAHRWLCRFSWRRYIYVIHIMLPMRRSISRCCSYR
jgi:GPN-loop GTPase